jgi:transcription elongation factor Elf1
MAKQPNKITITCNNCGVDHVFDVPETLEQFRDWHKEAVVNFQNELDWQRQRIEELEDQLFVMVEFKPAIMIDEGGDPF